MSYFDDEKNALNYIGMCAECDSSALINQLTPHLSQHQTLLEIGMGPGNDLAELAKRFDVTGSDSSIHFVNHYATKHPTAKLLKLDSTTLNTEQTFDVLYSNKVLHYLNDAHLQQSFTVQAERLNNAGIALHSFWRGSGAETFAGDTCYYRQIEDISPLLPANLKLIDSGIYTEMDDEDSFWVILAKQ